MNRGPVFASVWPTYQALMAQFANSRPGFTPLFSNDLNVRGEAAWVTFPLGYKQFRRAIGLNDSVVDLWLTGQMISDLLVTSKATQHRKKITARRFNGKFIKGKVGSGNKVIASLRLRLEFDNPVSERIAGYIENGRFPRKFLFFSDTETTTIINTFSESVRGALKGEDPLGTFSKFGF